MAARKRQPSPDLLARLAALEERVARLEAGKAPPGDGRAAAVERSPKVKRCPGCGLPLRRSKGRCAACGRPLDPISPGRSRAARPPPGRR
ncbi:conserved hypothetical protein [Anaeromyxobacter dehalogenans 2CP-1]|uniref:Zinc ribbon domain-containing protein n=1 Tax=Anaeromyxobacter dehalogenans (strain ATCC BAA-258 / DSM 21875 / 2CP-1) TaxID=455488 RepID=B8J8B8_ANAD2|nr:hypothetical protein [Anaeromyxobacter dehalogenans]ACL65417.1 conserved hypothetical protein [Anaeromyxobacter dehalogenans 2CP-1]